MKKAVITLLLLLCYSNIQCWRFKKYPYADLSLVQKVKHDGYPLQIYKVVTEDQYILTLFRIQYGRNSTNIKNRSPVLLVHGMFANAEVYILLGKYKSLAYYLADSGFDVWMLNSRGSLGSEKHLRYNLDKDSSYWNFDFQEIGVYDVPAAIDLIMEKTQQKVFVIGHSQGNTCYYIMSTERPEYNKKVKMAIAYAPSVVLHHQNIPSNQFLIHISSVLEVIYKFFGIKEMLPYFHQLIKFTLKPLCREQTYFLDLCTIILSMVGTHTSFLLDKDLVPVIVSLPFSRVSSKQIFHYLQIARSGSFQKYDYGPKKNLEIYNQTKPFNYDLSLSTAPTALFFAENDEYCTLQSREETVKKLPNVVFQKMVDYKYFNHIDFVFGRNASNLVYEPTVKLFKEFDKEYVA